MDNTKELRTISLCTGFSGIERGIESTGQELRTLAHVEIEAFAIANLVSKMESKQLAPCPIWTDPCHWSRFEERLISSLVDTPASPLASQESDLAEKTLDTYGHGYVESSTALCQEMDDLS